MSRESYYLAVQTGSGISTTTVCGVEIPIWSSEGFRTVSQAADAVATYCGHHPETVERMGFVFLEISPPPK